VSPLSVVANAGLSTTHRAESDGLPDRISAPPAEQSSSKAIAPTREVLATHRVAAGYGLAAVVARSSEAGVPFLPLKAAASLVDIPLNLGQIEQTLEATIAEIKHLSPDVAGWLASSRVSPFTVAFAAAAISGGSAYYYLRRRSAREADRKDDEESSSWLFSRLQSVPSQ
jgi:hypothetical protein